MSERYAPASDGPLRDLRRGLLRSVPFALLAALLVPLDLPVGVSAITLCLGWVPFTLLEGWATRRPVSLADTLLVFAGVGALIVLGLLGGLLQVDYLRGLERGLGPQGAIAALSPGLSGPDLEGLLFLCVVGWFLTCVVLGIRFVTWEGWEGASGRLTVLAFLPIALASLLGFLSSQFGTLSVLAMSLAILGAVLPAVFVLWLITGLADLAEARLWPPATD